MAGEDYSVKTKVTADVSNFEKGIKTAQSLLSSFSKGITSVTKSLMGLFAIQNFDSFVKSIGNIATSFDDARSQIVKGTGATGKALDDLSNSVSNAMRMGVGRSAEEIGSMIADLNTRFGVTGEVLENLVDDFDMFAGVTGQDTKVAIESVADVMLKWNIETEQADDLLDQLTVASQASGASINELEDGLKIGQTTFKQFGMSVTKSTAFLASLKKNGIDSVTALAGLRVALVNFTKDGRNAETAFKEVTEQIKNASTESEALNIAIDTFGSRMGTELVKVFRDGGQSVDEMTKALMGAKGALKGSDEASRTTKDALEELQAVFTSLFAGMNGTGLRDLIDGISESLKSLDVSSIRTAIGNFTNEVKTLALNIGTIIKTIYDNFKTLFTRLAEMLGVSQLSFDDWLEGVYETLDTLYRIVQDAFALVFAILDEDWEVAWEYAKLVVLRTVEAIIKNLDEMTSQFKDKIQKILFIAKIASSFLPNTVKAPLEGALTTIQKITANTEKERTALENAISATEANIESMTGKSADVQLKALDRIGKKRETYVRDFEAGEIDIQSAVTDTAGIIDDTTSVISEWDKKLLKQRLDDLDEWSDAYRDTQIEIIEAERDSELKYEHSAEEIAKINKYYNKEILKVYKESEEAKRKHVAETVKAIAGQLQSIASNTVKVFTKVVSTIKNAFSSGFDLIKKLVSINVSDMLDNILAFEDAVLTFFVVTLPQLPKFVNSVVQSIKTLLKTLKASIDRENIAEAVFQMIKSIGDNLPEMVDDLLYILESVVGGALDGLLKWLDEEDGFNTIFKIVLSVQKSVEKFVTEGLDNIVTVIENHIDDFANFLAESMASANRTLPSLIKSILRLINAIIQAIAKAFENEDFQNSIVESIEGVVSAIVEIAPKLVTSIVKLIFAIINAIVPKLPEILLKIMQEITGTLSGNISELVSEFSKGLMTLFKKTMTFEFWRDVLQGLVQALGTIVESAFGGIASAFESDSSTQTGSQAGDVALGFATGGISTLGHALGWWAKGTNNAPAGLSVVGEAGPELIKFRGGEQVLNNRNTNKALANMGGSTNNFNVTFNNLHDTTAFAMMNQLKQYNRQMAINGIM